MTHSDSTYRQYTQALEEERQQQLMHNTMPNGTLPNGFAGGVTPTNVSQNDTLALRSAYEKEEEEEQQPLFDQQTTEYNAQEQYEQYSQYDQVPEQAYVPPQIEPTTNEQHPQEQEWNQAPPQAPIVQISEPRDYRKLWKWAYKEACKSCGITVGKRKHKKKNPAI